MSIGQALATARHDAGLSVEQVSDRTRIRRTLIVAIEVDDFSRCGGDFYARGHLRAIATAIGIEAGPLLAQLDATTVGLTPPPRASAVFEAERVSRRERRSPNWSAVMAAALVAVIGIAGWQIINSSTDSRAIETVVGAPPQSTPAPGRPGEPSGAAPEAPLAPLPDAADVPGGVEPVQPGAAGPQGDPPGVAPPGIVAAAPRTTVQVAVAAATAASWISVTDSADSTVFSGTIGLGEVLTYSDPRRLRLVMGNAGGLSLTVNGVLVGTPGAPGQVVRQEFGLADPVQG